MKKILVLLLLGLVVLASWTPASAQSPTPTLGPSGDEIDIPYTIITNSNVTNGDEILEDSEGASCTWGSGTVASFDNDPNDYLVLDFGELFYLSEQTNRVGGVSPNPNSSIYLYGSIDGSTWIQLSILQNTACGESVSSWGITGPWRYVKLEGDSIVASVMDYIAFRGYTYGPQEPPDRINGIQDWSFELWPGEDLYWYHLDGTAETPAWYCELYPGSLDCEEPHGYSWKRHNYIESDLGGTDYPPYGYGGLFQDVFRLANGPAKCGEAYQQTDTFSGPVYQDFHWGGGTMYFKAAVRGDFKLFGIGTDYDKYGVASAYLTAQDSTTVLYTLVNDYQTLDGQWHTEFSSANVPFGDYRLWLKSADGRTVEWDDIGLSEFELSETCDIQDVPTATPTITPTATERSGEPSPMPTDTPDPSRTSTPTKTKTVTPTASRTVPATITAQATRTGTATRTAIPATSTTSPGTSTPITTPTANGYYVTVTPGGPTLTPGGPVIPVQPEPNWTPCPPGTPGCELSPYTAECIRPPELQYNSVLDVLPNIYNSVQSIPWWMDYEVCEVKDWLAFKPQHMATLVSIPTAVSGKEPFGTINEVQSGAATLQAHVEALDYGEGLEGVKDEPDAEMFLPGRDPASPWNGGQIDLTVGSTYKSTYCNAYFADEMGTLLAAGVCTVYNILRDIHMLPWFQFMINLTCILVIIFATVKTFYGELQNFGGK